MLNTAKWIKKGTKVIIDAKTTPKETTTEGQYGKRSAFIINTIDFGLIYVNPMQLVTIVVQLKANDYKNITVEL